MRVNSLHVVVFILGAAGLCCGAAAQQEALRAADPGWAGLQLDFVTRAEPPGDNVFRQLPGEVITEGGYAHHVIKDPPNKIYLGYDVRVEADSAPSKATVHIEPLRLPQGTQLSVGSDWILLAPSQFPVLRDVHIGDTVALDLLVNPQTHQKIVDYITLRYSQPVTLSNSELLIDRPRVYLNGRLLQASVAFAGGASGAVVWLTIDGYGRFAFSFSRFDTDAAFITGQTGGTQITFRDQTGKYRIECDRPIAASSTPRPLYVFHRTMTGPQTSKKAISIGATDTFSRLPADF